MLDFNFILAQAAPAGGGSTLIFIFGTMLVFYFFIMRPQLKKQKEARKFRENIAKGDKVVTVGGIHGKVLDVNDKTAILQVAKGEIRVDLAGISSDGAADGEAIKNAG
jgi:preprotein translocase subunit YajC